MVLPQRTKLAMRARPKKHCAQYSSDRDNKELGERMFVSSQILLCAQITVTHALNFKLPSTLILQELLSEQILSHSFSTFAIIVALMT
jgi:hypothetical protein